MTQNSTYSLALEKRPVGHGAVDIVDLVNPDHMAEYHPWPNDYLDLVVMHFHDLMQHPGLVVLLYHLRRALGATGMIWANCVTQRSSRTVFSAMTLTGNKLMYMSSDRRLSYWTGEWWHEEGATGQSARMKKGDLSKEISEKILRLVPKTAQVVEVFPDRGVFSISAVHHGLQPTIIVKPETSAKDRLLSYIDSRKR